jgi:hypothetical protein
VAGRIIFRAYGPDDPSCSGAPAFTDAKSVSGDGAYVSGGFTPVRAGSYRWIASYSGDGDNDRVASACGASTTVLAAGPPARPTKPGKPAALPSNHFRFAKPVLNRRRGTATLAVVVPGPGRLRLAGKGIKGVVRKARRAGRVRLTVKPKGKVSRRLRRTGRAKVRVKVTFTPRGGVPRTKARIVRLVERPGGGRRSGPRRSAASR